MFQLLVTLFLFSVTEQLSNEISSVAIQEGHHDNQNALKFQDQYGRLDADAVHEIRQNTDGFAILADKTEQQDGIETVGKHKSGREKERIAIQIDAARQQNGIGAEERQIWRETYPTGRTLLTQQNDIKAGERDESSQEVETTLEVRDSPKGTAQPPKKRSWRQYVSFGFNRGQKKEPRKPKNCKKCCRKVDRKNSGRTPGTCGTGPGECCSKASNGGQNGLTPGNGSPGRGGGRMTRDAQVSLMKTTATPATTGVIGADAGQTAQYYQGQGMQGTEQKGRRVKRDRQVTTSRGDRGCLMGLLAGICCFECCCD